MFADRLKQLRSEKGLVQKDMAKFLNITTSAYGYYEQGKRNPDPKTLMKLSDFFNVSVDYLLGKTDVRNYLDDSNTTIALHSDETSLDYSDLSDEAKKEVQDFIEYVRHKYKDK